MQKRHCLRCTMLKFMHHNQLLPTFDKCNQMYLQMWLNAPLHLLPILPWCHYQPPNHRFSHYPSLLPRPSISINCDNISSCLPEELRLLTNLALFHINSNKFCTNMSHKFDRLKILFKIDFGINHFTELTSSSGSSVAEVKIPRSKVE